MSKKIQFCKHIKTQFWKYIYPVLAALFIGFIPAFCVQWIFHDPPPKRLISEYMYYKLEDEKEDIHAYGFLIFNNDKNKIIDNIECEINFVSTKLELKQAKTFPKSFKISTTESNKLTFNIPKLRRKESFFLIITVSPQLPPYEVFKENISIKGKYHGHNVYTEYENIKEISKKNEITDALKSKRWDGFVGHYKEDYKREN